MKSTIAQKALFGTKTILLLDDEQMVLEVAKPMLEKLGYTVRLVESGEQAVAFYEKNSAAIDLVIIDMMMPGMNGGQVFDRLKEINPNVKALLSSGYSVNGEAAGIMARGCRGFIQKPFGIVELSKKVRSILDE